MKSMCKWSASKPATIIMMLVCLSPCHSLAFGGSTDNTAQERRQYQQDHDRVVSLSASLFPGKTNDLKTFENLADDIDKNWSKRNREYHARLLLEICKPLSSGSINDDRRYGVARKYALSALEKPDMIPLLLELELIGHVMMPLRASNPLSGKDYAECRTLSATNSNPVTFTAHDRASTPTITATYGSGSCTVTFNVVEPSAVMIEQEAGTGIRHTTNTVSCGFKGRPYIQPDDVSFKYIAIREGAVNGVGTGYLSPKNGVPHAPGTWPGTSVGDVVAGKGSKVDGVDTISSGDYTWTPYGNGTFTWNIPWYFRVGVGSEKQFTTVTHQETSDDAGQLTISKGGTSKSAALNDPTSTY